MVRVQNEWIPSVPQNFSTKDVMIIGTAGFTAMLAVKKMLNHGTEPRSGKVLVTGASGGLGSLAVMILKKLKFEVVAATTKPNNIDYLKFIGAKEVILVQELEEPKKLLDKQKWAAVIDTLGSRTLAIACAATKIDGAVISCGNVQGMDLHTSVAPFILRGISLYGVNSVYRSTSNRKQIWNLLSDTLSCSELLQISSEFSFDKTILIAENVFKGETFGRSIIKLN